MPTWINTWNLISPKWSSWYKPSKPAFPQSSSPQWMAAPSFQLFGIKLLGSSFTFSFEDHVPVTRKFCWFYLKRILGINLHLTLSSAVSLAWSYLAWIIAAASTLVFLLLTLTSFQSVLNSHQVIIVIWISSCSSFAPKPLAPSHSEKPWTPSIFSHPLVASLTLSPINSLSYTLHSSNTGLLVLQSCHAHSSHRACALALSSTTGFFSCGCAWFLSLTSFSCIFKCHRLREAFLTMLPEFSLHHYLLALFYFSS